MNHNTSTTCSNSINQFEQQQTYYIHDCRLRTQSKYCLPSEIDQNKLETRIVIDEINHNQPNYLLSSQCQEPLEQNLNVFSKQDNDLMSMSSQKLDIPLKSQLSIKESHTTLDKLHTNLSNDLIYDNDNKCITVKCENLGNTDEIQSTNVDNVIQGKNRETWDSKIDFLLAVIGFAVDLGNIWRFPFICYRNGGGAFLIPYLVMYIFGGLPLFYLELALGQYQRSGCLTVWKRICPLFSGIGFGICIIASYTAWYYNTIIAWALFYMIDAMKPHIPWDGCNNWWNTNSCVTVYERLINHSMLNASHKYELNELVNLSIANLKINGSGEVFSSTEEYFYRRVLQIQYAEGYNNVGPIRWEISLCLVAVFTIVYFSLWKGVKSSGKAVWVTATMPYVILTILLIRGLTLEGSLTGIKYYLTPNFSSLLSTSVWSDAASQIFFSLGPGFGVLLALSSYNKFHNNCYRDAMITSFINCATSFVSGFVVFSVLGYMCFRMGKTMEDVANEGPGLVFIAYPEAIATLAGSTFWAIIFMLMLITLGLDSTFGGLEAIITAVMDSVPALSGRRELFVLAVVVYCFIGALASTTCGGYLVLTMLDRHGAPISILFIVFCECVALCWFYGTKRFCQDVQMMLGFKPGIFWQICWAYISPIFLLGIFIANIVSYETQPVSVLGVVYEPTTWVIALSWAIVFSSPIFIPILMIYQLLKAKGTFLERLRFLTTPEDRPAYGDQQITLNAIGEYVPKKTSKTNNLYGNPQ
ncbi:unnamed protein product [Schistosoma intercalatum]|nr:unnamed protein product [Schistosoma intercalatum]CAH8498208.1 unnamed protein product [Schistosoma intercalatum]